jgi:hypothetical protein
MRHSLRFVVLVVIVAIAAAAVRTAAPDITGTWTASFETGIGPQNYTYTFVVAKDGSLTGTATGGFGVSPLTEGKVKDDLVTFVEMMDSAIRVDYTGTIVSADEIRFTRQVGEMATETLVATRVRTPAK